MTILDENELQSIKDTIALETNPIVRLLMRQHVEIVIGPYSLKDKFVAMKELMAYTKAKPANVTELKVTDTQDAFADLMEEIAGKGK
ncbi:hypothetical protein ASG59_18715 [Methylobacterium sp. Leaf466]|nr:hypothetical protein ASG59_18715 [Methylobacterium sp. Leaf466]